MSKELHIHYLNNLNNCTAVHVPIITAGCEMVVCPWPTPTDSKQDYSRLTSP